MAMTVAASINASVNVTAGGTIEGVDGEHKPALTEAFNFTDGNGADDKANVCLATFDNGILLDGVEDIDLSGASGFFGETIEMVAIKCIMFKNTSTDPGTVLELGGDANSVPIFNDVDNAIKVPAGGFFCWSVNTEAGKITVTAATGDILQVTNLDGVNAGQYQLIVVGETA